MNERHLIELLRVSTNTTSAEAWNDELDWLYSYGYINVDSDEKLGGVTPKGKEAIDLAIVSINARFED